LREVWRIDEGRRLGMVNYSRIWHVGWKWGSRMLWIYLVVVLVFALLQTKLIFVGASTQGKAESLVTPTGGAELVRMRSARGTEIVGLFGKAVMGDGSVDADAGKKPTVIWFYGNAMCMNDGLEEFRRFRRLGANVMMVDYAGYGMSGGEAGESGCYEAAKAAYEYLLTRGDIDWSKLVPAGWSLGGAVAIDLAARHSSEGHICGVMTFCTFTSMVDEARWHYPIFPVELMLKHRFESEKKIAGVHVPILIGHGRRDSVVPFGMSERLAKAAGGPVVRLICEGADHNDFFDVAAEEVDREAGAFLRRVGM
jgi:pimeloyl-ACP methyl ester carboxylesterase